MGHQESKVEATAPSGRMTLSRALKKTQSRMESTPPVDRRRPKADLVAEARSMCANQASMLSAGHKLIQSPTAESENLCQEFLGILQDIDTALKKLGELVSEANVDRSTVDEIAAGMDEARRHVKRSSAKAIEFL